MEIVYITINSIAPYVGEMNSLLSLPEYSKSRVRFKKSWLPEITNYNELTGKDGIVLLRQYNLATTLIPIRQIKISKVDIVGEIIYIEFVMSKIPLYPVGIDDFTAVISRLYKPLSGSFDDYKYPNHNNSDLQNLIFMGASLTTLEFVGEDSKYDEIKNWGILIEHLSSMKLEDGTPIFEEYDFIKLVSLQNFDDKQIELKTKSNGEGNYFYSLKPTENYRAKFLQRTFTGKSGNSATSNIRRLSLVPDSNLVVSLRTDSIHGKYDILTASFRTEDFKKTQYSDINVLIDDLEGSTQSHPIKIPIKLESSLRWTVILTVIFVGSLVTHYLAEPISCQLTWLDAKIIREILLPILILTGSGLTKDWKEFTKRRISP